MDVRTRLTRLNHAIMMLLFTTVFVASLFGSLHCVGMCGPLAVLASASQSTDGSIQSRKPRWSLITAYHLGRIASYAVIGLIAGFIGSGIHETGTLLGLQRLAAQLAGGTMLVIGLLAIVRLISGEKHMAHMPKRLQSALHQSHVWARSQPPMRRATVIGMLTAILPCGWLYAFVLMAAGTASALSGSIVMIAFGLGSVPAMTTLVAGATSLLGNSQKLIPWASAILVTFIGLYTLSKRSQTDLASLHNQQVTSTQSGKPVSIQTQIDRIGKEELPCCKGR